ncbi:MAG: CAAX amino terminal protease family [Bacillota bacterium]|nr:MAG: CAAX amino terminal protease family [Bacillota bacterium]MBS3950088.1 CPBP family intramembrane metalloprotease [Peptococcaceae bacterium]
MIKPAILQHFSLTGSSPLDQREVHWGLRDILKLFGLYILVFLLLPVPHKMNSPIRLRIADWGAMLIVLLAYRHFCFWPSYEYFGLRWSDFKAHFKTGVVWGVAIKVLPTVLTIVVTIIITMFMPLEDISGNNPLPDIGHINLEWAIVALQIGIIAPIVEEIIYRGLIHALLRKRYGAKPAIIYSSLFFGILHGFGFLTVFATLAGVGFALLYEKTGSLAPCIIAHGVGNLASVLLSTLLFI